MLIFPTGQGGQGCFCPIHASLPVPGTEAGAQSLFVTNWSFSICCWFFFFFLVFFFLPIFFLTCKSGTSLVVQCLRHHIHNAGGLGSVLGQGTRSHWLQ